MYIISFACFYINRRLYQPLRPDHTRDSSRPTCHGRFTIDWVLARLQTETKVAGPMRCCKVSICGTWGESWVPVVLSLVPWGLEAVAWWDSAHRVVISWCRAKHMTNHYRLSHLAHHSLTIGLFTCSWRNRGGRTCRNRHAAHTALG